MRSTKLPTKVKSKMNECNTANIKLCALCNKYQPVNMPFIRMCFSYIKLLQQN